LEYVNQLFARMNLRKRMLQKSQSLRRRDKFQEFGHNAYK
jgi:hypothetical protein